MSLLRAKVVKLTIFSKLGEVRVPRGMGHMSLGFIEIVYSLIFFGGNVVDFGSWG